MEDMDLTVGEILQAANRDDIQALTNKTLRNFDDLMEHGLQCQAGLDVLSILMTLQREADFRGLNPDQAR
jgi:hypothetical protein